MNYHKGSRVIPAGLLPKEARLRWHELEDEPDTDWKCEHFELNDGDSACLEVNESMEANGSISSVNLLPVAAGSGRTIKRRASRHRRQQARTLAQFLQLDTEKQNW